MVKRQWSLEAARALFPEVRERTERAVSECDSLGGNPAAADDAKAQAILSRWAREMDALGVEVKGVWLVDFDNGSGYYCWHWPEERLEYFHGYEDGFDGRTRIQ